MKIILDNCDGRPHNLGMTLLQRFKFYREINPPALAYHFAREKHVNGSYTVPKYMYMWMLAVPGHKAWTTNPAR